MTRFFFPITKPRLPARGLVGMRGTLGPSALLISSSFSVVAAATTKKNCFPAVPPDLFSQSCGCVVGVKCGCFQNQVAMSLGAFSRAKTSFGFCGTHTHGPVQKFIAKPAKVTPAGERVRL